MCLMTEQQKNTIHMELHAILISGPAWHTHKGRSYKDEILICVYNAHKKFLNHKSNISKTDPVTNPSFLM